MSSIDDGKKADDDKKKKVYEEVKKAGRKPNHKAGIKGCLCNHIQFVEMLVDDNPYSKTNNNSDFTSTCPNCSFKEGW